MITHSKTFYFNFATCHCHLSHYFTVAYSFEGNKQFMDKGKSWFYANEGLLIGCWERVSQSDKQFIITEYEYVSQDDMKEDQHDHDKVREIPSQLCSHRTTPSPLTGGTFDL